MGAFQPTKQPLVVASPYVRWAHAHQLAPLGLPQRETAVLVVASPSVGWAEAHQLACCRQEPVSYTHLRAHETSAHL
eukprot:2786315-Alexandrium_andersonii.AAC.1